MGGSGKVGKNSKIIEIKHLLFSKETLKAWCFRHRLNCPRPRFWILLVSFITFVWFLFSLPDPLFDSPYTTVIEDVEGNFLSARIAFDHQWRFPESDSVPYKFREALRCFEDQYFYYHPGVNPVSMCRALLQNIRKGKVVSGGSTISMQVIRLSLDHQSRNIPAKLHEMILAVRLELRYTKQEILNLYASHAPFGSNVVGLEAAAWRYFGRPASRLSWGETASLAVLPNAPALIFPGKNHQLYLKKRNKLLDKLCLLKVIDPTTCELAKAEPLPGKPQPLSRHAPHLLDKIIKDGHSGQRIKTSIHSRLQQQVSAIVQKYARSYAANYIQNMAVIVTDTRTGEVKAYVGNAEIAGLKNAPYVDNAVAPRSSGSILKPFLYAAMLNEGELLPRSLVSDIPTHFGNYAPENFEKTYMGVVPADEALAHSLNVPAVRELDQYGVAKLYGVLQNLGFTTINKTPDYYGLSLILGGAEVSLWETVAAYASLGRSLLSYNENHHHYLSGDYRSLSYFHCQDKSGHLVSTQRLGAASLWFTLEALSTVNRPWGEIGWEYFASTHKVAWKTGTSFGSRDAWAVGVTPGYTVGVWVGNSSGEGRPGLTGVTHAAPVMFEIFKQLHSDVWFEKPLQDMVKISVCKQSGFRSGDNCEEEQVWVPKKGVKVKACPYHIRVFFDSTGTHRVNGDCYPVSKMKIFSWFVLPPAQEYFFRPYHPEYVMLPLFGAGCMPQSEAALDILVPDNNTAIFIPKGINGEDGLVIFEAVHRKPDAELFWHIDNEYVGRTKGVHKIEISPVVGNHLLTVEDGDGNIVRRRFKIQGK
jgi:penicillin-binding protein 1C